MSKKPTRRASGALAAGQARGNGALEEWRWQWRVLSYIPCTRLSLTCVFSRTKYPKHQVYIHTDRAALISLCFSVFVFFFSGILKTFSESSTCHFHSHSLVIHLPGKMYSFLVGKHCSFLGSFASEEGEKGYRAITIS